MKTPHTQARQENAEQQADRAGDNPALSNVVERNIRTIVDLRLKADRDRTLQERLADGITATSGRMAFVYLHVVWFSAWIILNTGQVGISPFDPYPYGLLTMIVSLEAIFLSTFVLISQNRLSQEADERANLDLQIGLLTERELTRALKMLDAIQQHVGVGRPGARELADLEKETRPEDVLAEIDRIQRRELGEKAPPGERGRDNGRRV